jgi:outer membrane autotransporter protein
LVLQKGKIAYAVIITLLLNCASKSIKQSSELMKFLTLRPEGSQSWLEGKSIPLTSSIGELRGPRLMHIIKKSTATKEGFFMQPAAYRIQNAKYLFALTFLLAATGLQAQNWNVGTGSWFVPQNWTPAMVPTPNSVATITNGGTAQVVGGTANAGELTVGATSSVQMGANGFLSVGSAVINSGSITAPAPTTGAFTQGLLVAANGVNISNAGLISGENGIVFNAGGTVTNTTGGTIQGVSRNDNGFDSFTGSGISAFGNSTPVTVINEAGATIKGLGTFSWGIHTGLTPINITNSGVISGTVNAINVNGGGTFINEAGASITSTTFQPISVTSGGVENIINSGTISSSFGGIGFSNGNASGTITNNAGGIIRGTGVNSFGIADGSTNVINVINSGTISGGGSAIILSGGGSVTNNATGSITGSPSASTNGFTAGGVLVSGATGNVTNSGLISGQCGIVLSNGGTITNNAGGTIQGIGLNENGLNSTTGSGILLAGNSSVNNSITNNAGGMITGTGTDSWGIKSYSTPVNITNFGAISGDLVGINVNGGGTLNNEVGAFVTAKTGVAVIMTSAETETIVNSGTIMSSGSAAIAFRDGTSGSVTNNPGGVLTGTGGVAILSQTPATTGSINVLNAGTINGAVNLGNASNVVTLVTGGKINGNLNLGPSSGSSLVLDGSGQEAISQAVTGSITNSGSLTKQGTGIWALDKRLSAPISTSVQAGVLVVDSTLNTPVVNVHAGGTLAGFGTITGSVINSGIVAPGTLQLSGNYTQNAGGTLLIGIAGLAPGQHGLLAVNGHASLAGTLQLISLGGFTLHAGDQVTFLTANGGLSGSFDTVRNAVATGTLVQGVITTSANAIVLEGQQGSFTQIPGVTLTPNQFAVGKMLNSAVGNPAAAPLFAFLNSQPVGNLQNDYNLIAPTQITSINATAVSLGNVQMSNLEQQLASIRAGSTGFSSAGFAISGGAASFGQGFAGVSGPEGKSGPPVLAPTPSNRWGVFVTGLGEFTTVDSTSNAPGYDVNTGGFTLGVDYRLTPNFALGLTAGYAHTSVGLDSPGGNVDVNAGTIGMYATVFGNGFYLDAAVSGGPSGYTTRRTALQGTANGSTNGGDLNVLAAAGYDWKKGNLTVGPTASFQYSYVGLGAFTETGSLAPLKFPNQNTESERTAFGAKATYEWKIGHITAIPQVSAAWQHEFGDTAYSVVAGLASGAGNSFTVLGQDIGRDSVLVGAGATFILNERVSAYIYYDGEFARTNYVSNNVTGGVRISF